MELFYTIFICFIAGIGAGLGTGFAGMSAAVAISPILITFLDMDPYAAVGIALASDVLASAISAYTYGRNKNLDIKNGLAMMFTVMAFTLVGSWVASLLPDRTMGNFSMFTTLLMGIKFILQPVNTTKEAMAQADPKKRLIKSMVWGAVIGCICGFVGAGGGMMMLLVLTTGVGGGMMTAVGPSVFLGSVPAPAGGVSFFAMAGSPDWLVLGVCVASTLLWAQIGSKFANKTDTKTLNRATGLILVLLSCAVLAVEFFVK